MSDPELDRGLSALDSVFSPTERWPELDRAIEVAERLDQAIDDEDLQQLILELEQYVKAREENAQRIASALRVLRLIAKSVLVVLR